MLYPIFITLPENPEKAKKSNEGAFALAYPSVSFGIDVFKNSISDTDKLGIIEPLKVKIQAISSATEASVSILRIDDMISSKGTRGMGGGQGGMPGGPGGMGGMEE